MSLKKLSVIVIASIISAVVLAVCLHKVVDYSNHREISITVYYEGETYEKHKLEVGNTLMMLKNPIRDGYEFKGWYADKEYTTEYDFNKPIEDDIVIYAKMEKLN